MSRSRYFEYHDQVEESLCPGLFGLLDEHAKTIGTRIGSDPSSGPPFRYYRYADSAALGTSEIGANAASVGDAVFSTNYFDAHEQAHAYVDRAWGASSNGLLSEGIAVALSCVPGEAVDWSLDWRQLLNLSGDSYSGYANAGRFVMLLVRQYGIERFSQFYRAVPVGVDARDFEREFAQEFPESLDQAWREAGKLTFTSPRNTCFRDWECWSTGPLNADETVTDDCSGQIHRTLTVGEGQRGVVLVSTDASVMFWKNCLDDTAPYLTLRDDPTHPQRGTVHWMTIAPGTYALDGVVRNMRLQEYLVAPLIGDTCETAGEVSLDGQLSSQINLSSEDGVSGWIRLAVTSGGAYDVLPVLPFSNVVSASDRVLSVCDGCGESANCTVLQSGNVLTIPIPDGSVLHLQNIDGRSDSGSAGAGVWFHPIQGGASK